MSFHDQFVLAQGPRAHPQGWGERTAHGWTLASHPSLPVVPLLEGDGRTAGWLLGWVVAEDGALLHERASLPVEAVTGPGGTGADPGAVEDHLYRWAGRWACLLLRGRARLHLDPAGSLAVVHSLAERAVASTTTVLRWGDPELARRWERRTLRRSGYHPAGVTSAEGVQRLLPNHYLDLASFEPVRHWPTAPLEPVSSAAATAERVEVVAGAVRHLLVSLAARHELLLPLTAGRDSRLVAAAARPVLDRTTFVTFGYEDDRRTDVSFAREVARRHHLDLRVLPLPPVPEADARRYLERVGYDAHEGKARDFDLAARALPLDRAWVTGFAGEVGGAPYWRGTDVPAAPRPDELLRLVRLPPDERHEDALARWLKEVPHRDVHDLLDLAYLEMRVGCWAGPQLYGAAPFTLSAIAVNSRAAFTAMLQLPLEHRRRRELPPAATRLLWPELARPPYGRAPGVRGWPVALRRTAGAARARLALGTRAARLTGRSG
ncbi:asparagine synthetase B family protein [Kineococcus sp. SYSU DK004]|uniref:hypothetical protein n=1 Tax=Kineococcus sp. SYSU DK004 TaxID=3383125 RepID=UPI003D7EF014